MVDKDRNGRLAVRLERSQEGLSEKFRVFAERLSRHIYWGIPTVRRFQSRWKRRVALPLQQCRREDLVSYLRKIGVSSGALALVHTRTTGVQILCPSTVELDGPVAQAQLLLQDLMRLIGSDGTLAMPVHAMYQKDTHDTTRDQNRITIYDPKRTPCAVGLVNELFWRSKGVQRSLFPYNALAAWGSLSDELLRNNLNKNLPSPHGLDSGYYRICRFQGLVLSIGVPLRECITLAHVVEEVRSDWPIADFFEVRKFRVIEECGARDWEIRVRRPEYARYAYCRKKMGRDLVAEGVIHEGRVGTVVVDWARANDVFEFFRRKTDSSPYPYYGWHVMRKPWRKAF